MALSSSSLYIAFHYEGDRPKYLCAADRGPGSYLMTRNIVWNGVLNADEYYEAYEIASGDTGSMTETQFLQYVSNGGIDSVWLHSLDEDYCRSDITAYYGTGCDLWHYSGNTTTQQVYIQGSGYVPVTIYLFTNHEFFPFGENGWIDSSTSLVGGNHKREYKNTLYDLSNTSRRDNSNISIGDGVKGTVFVELFHNPGQLANVNLGLGLLSYNTQVSGSGPIGSQTYWLNNDSVYDFYSAMPCGSAHSPTASGGPVRKVFAVHNYAGTPAPNNIVHVAYTGQATNQTISDNPSYGYYGYSLIGSPNNWVQHTSGDGRKYFGITVTTTNLHTYVTMPVTAGKIYTFNMRVYCASSYHGIIISNAEVSNATGQITSLGLARITGANSASVYEYNCTSSGTIYIYFHTNSRSLVGPGGYATSIGDVEVIEEDAPVPSNITITFNKNSGIGGTDSISVAPGCSLASMPDIIPPDRDGCTFQGYYTTSQTSGGTQYYNSTGEAVRGGPSSATTLYARWKAAITYEVETPVSVYCTNQAEVASSTSAALLVPISVSGSSSVNTVIHTESSHNWVVSSDGRTVTIPSGTSANTYSYTIHLSVPANTATSGGYLGNTLDVPGTINLLAVTATYGNLIQNDTGIDQTNDFPASQITISTSNIANYFNDPGTCTQVVSYSNGTARSGTVTRAWSGTSKTLSSLGTTPTSRQSVSINTWTLKFTGEGNKTWSETVSTGYRSANTVTYGTPVISHTSPISMPAGGGTYTLQPTVSQSATWTSGSSSTLTDGTFTYGVITSKSGYSLNTSTGVVTVTNNASTTACNGFLVGIDCTMNGVTASTKSVRFNQPAGEIQYDTPEIDSFTYTQFPAAGGTGSPTVTFHQGYTWNGVPDMNSGVITTGGAYQYSTTGTLPNGFSTNTNYTLNGSVGWGNNTTENPRSAASNLRVRVTANGITSAYETCTLCSQAAGSKVYGTPSITKYTYTLFPANGATQTPSEIEYEIPYTWNGVSNSGGTISTGGTLSFTRLSGCPSWATAATNFETTGNLKVQDRATTTGSGRTAAAYLTVTVSYGGVTSSAFTCTYCSQSSNVLVWGSLDSINHSTPVSLAAAGETYTMSPTISNQVGTYTSGRTTSYTPTFTYEVKTTKTGYSLSSNQVTVTNNESTSARNGFVVTITATGKPGTDSTLTKGLGQTTTKDITFNQAAGAKVYGNPVVTGYSYSTFSAAGETDKYPTVTYTQSYTWNGTGTSTTDSYTYDSTHTSPGGSLAFTFGSSTGFSTGTSFSTSGRMTAENRGTAVANSRDAKSALSVIATVNGLSSSSFTCTSCVQEGNYVTAITAKVASGNSTHITYSNINAGATSASKSTHGTATWTFTSGEQTTTSTAPSGGSASWNRTYELQSIQNGFTAVSSDGTLTATSYGTTPGPARTSGVVHSVLVVRYVHNSTYSTGGTVESQSLVADVTCTQKANTLTWGDLGTITCDTPVTVPVIGQSNMAMNPTIANQTGTFTSGATITYTPTFTYAESAAVTGFSLSSNKVSATNNTTESARTYTVVVTATGATGTVSTYEKGYNKTATKNVVFEQAAGSKVYAKPVVTAYYYSDFSAAGESKLPTLTFSQSYTWNGVEGSGSTNNYNGNVGARTFTKGSPVPTGFQLLSTSTGNVKWTNRGTVAGGVRDAKDILTVTVTYNGKTSDSYQCTSCKQNANEVIDLRFGVRSRTIKYGESTYGEVEAIYTSGEIELVPSNNVTFTKSNSDVVSITTTPNTFAIALCIDDFSEDTFGDIYDFYNNVYEGGGNIYDFFETVEYNGDTYYLWKYSEDNGPINPYNADNWDGSWRLYIVTDTNDWDTLMSYSVRYDTDNLETRPLVAMLNGDLDDYDNVSNYCIMDVY